MRLHSECWNQRNAVTIWYLPSPTHTISHVTYPVNVMVTKYQKPNTHFRRHLMTAPRMLTRTVNAQTTFVLTSTIHFENIDILQTLEENHHLLFTAIVIFILFWFIKLVWMAVIIYLMNVKLRTTNICSLVWAQNWKLSFLCMCGLCLSRDSKDFHKSGFLLKWISVYLVYLLGLTEELLPNKHLKVFKPILTL